MTRNETVAKHYEANYRKLVKRMTFRAGTEWDAEDIVQEAYERALSYFKSYNGQPFDNWFSTILNNVLRQYKNNEKGFAADTFEEEEQEGTPCSSVPDRIMSEIERRIARRLPVEQSEVLHHHFINGYQVKDICILTNYSPHAAFKLIERFRAELKDVYG